MDDGDGDDGPTAALASPASSSTTSPPPTGLLGLGWSPQQQQTGWLGPGRLWTGEQQEQQQQMMMMRMPRSVGRRVADRLGEYVNHNRVSE